MRPLWLALLFMASFWTCAAQATREYVSLPATAPMPEARPAEAPARPRSPQRVEIPKEEMESATALCRGVLEANTVVAELAEAALWSNGCGATGQLLVSAIKLADGKQVSLRPAALVRCDIAGVIADWVREDLVPLTSNYGGVARIEIAASYHCRPRNNIRGALLSEHGRANAIDVRAIVMNDGRRFGVDRPETPIKLLHDLRASSCARFTTVLGPGSDGYHENHFHLDLARRRNGFRLCQWSLPLPPAPLQHPLRAAQR